MAKANVNIENVDSFRQGIESQRDSVIDSVDTYNATIDETKESLTVEKEKTVTLIGEVQSTLSVLLSKIEEQRAKVEELQASLAALEASEPEEYETVYEPDVTDDEGNVISEGGSYEVETAAHIAWRNEVDKLSSELANEEDRLALMEEVESKLQAVASKLEEQQVKLDELYAELEGGQEEVNARRGEIESFSGSAIEKLNKISLALREYLAVKIHIEPMNSFTRISQDTSIFTYDDASSEEMSFAEEIAVRLKWKKKDADHDTFVDLKTTNPNYYQGDEWQVNCQRCVPTFEMRRRGYNVTAMPKTATNDHLSYYPFDVWKSPKIHEANGSGIDEIRQKMLLWGEGARAQVVVVWSGTNSGHTFMAEQRNGQTCFIDPQTSEIDVSYYFNDVRSGYTRFCRIDNLKPSKHIKACCKEI